MLQNRKTVVTKLQNILQRNYQLFTSSHKPLDDPINERIFAVALGFEQQVFSSSRGLTTYRNSVTELVRKYINSLDSTFDSKIFAPIIRYRVFFIFSDN